LPFKTSGLELEQVPESTWDGSGSSSSSNSTITIVIVVLIVVSSLWQTGNNSSNIYSIRTRIKICAYSKLVPFGSNNDGMSLICSLVRVRANGHQIFHCTVHSINCNTDNRRRILTADIHFIMTIKTRQLSSNAPFLLPAEAKNKFIIL